MKSNYTLNFTEDNRQTYRNLKKIPLWCSHHINKADYICQYKIPNGEMVIQALQSNDFSIEIIDMKSKSEKKAHMFTPHKRILLIAMLKGELTIKNLNNFMVGRFLSGYFYLASNRSNEYILSNTSRSENIEMVVIGIQQKWISQTIANDDWASALQEQVFSNEISPCVLPGCMITSKHINYLKQIYMYLIGQEPNLSKLEGMIQVAMAESIEDYFENLKLKDKDKVFEIRRYIEDNFTDSELSLKNISDLFKIPIRTLQDQFKKVFSQSVYNYILQCRLKYAHQLITDQKLSFDEVYYLAGFNNPETFRNQYKKFF